MRVQYLTVKHICHVAVVVALCCVTTLQTQPLPVREQTTVEAVADRRRFNNYFIHLFIYLFIDCSSSLGFISHGGTEKIYQNNIHNFPPAENQPDPPSKTITLEVPSSSLFGSSGRGCTLTLPEPPS